MIFKLTKSGCNFSDTNYQQIDQYIKKISNFLGDLDSDLIVLRLVIKGNKDKYYLPKTYPHRNTNYADRKPVLAYYEGSITFRLNKNQLYVHFKGQDIDECIEKGFKLILLKVDKFKDQHMVSESEYPDHNTIRRR